MRGASRPSCHVTVMSLSCHCHVTVKSLSCHCHVALCTVMLFSALQCCSLHCYVALHTAILFTTLQCCSQHGVLISALQCCYIQYVQLQCTGAEHFGISKGGAGPNPNCTPYMLSRVLSPPNGSNLVPAPADYGNSKSLARLQRNPVRGFVYVYT